MNVVKKHYKNTKESCFRCSYYDVNSGYCSKQCCKIINRFADKCNDFRLKNKYRKKRTNRFEVAR